MKQYSCVSCNVHVLVDIVCYYSYLLRYLHISASGNFSCFAGSNKSSYCDSLCDKGHRDNVSDKKLVLMYQLEEFL